MTNRRLYKLATKEITGKIETLSKEKILQERMKRKMKTLLIKECVNRETKKKFYVIALMTKKGYETLANVDYIKEVKPNERKEH